MEVETKTFFERAWPAVPVCSPILVGRPLDELDEVVLIRAQLGA